MSELKVTQQHLQHDAYLYIRQVHPAAGSREHREHATSVCFTEPCGGAGLAAGTDPPTRL
jgi:hypothetical protein